MGDRRNRRALVFAPGVGRKDERKTMPGFGTLLSLSLSLFSLEGMRIGSRGVMDKKKGCKRDVEGREKEREREIKRERERERGRKGRWEVGSCYKVLTDCCTANYMYRPYNTGRLHSALASSQEE